MAKRKPASGTSARRSAKAPRPPKAAARERPSVKRRRRSATAAVKKDTTLMQTDAGTKVLWGANQRRPTRI